MNKLVILAAWFAIGTPLFALLFRMSCSLLNRLIRPVHSSQLVTAPVHTSASLVGTRQTQFVPVPNFGRFLLMGLLLVASFQLNAVVGLQGAIAWLLNGAAAIVATKTLLPTTWEKSFIILAATILVFALACILFICIFRL